MTPIHILILTAVFFAIIRYTGDVIQADTNAAINIRVRGQDKQITRYMLASEVQAILVDRTVRYLHSIGHSVATALSLGWLIPKFKTIALKCESNYHPQGYVGTLKL